MSGCPWPQVPFEQAVLDATSGSPRVQRREYQTTGEIPVVDQGQEFIAGYSGREHAFRGRLPAVLFGDHTRAFKYVDFPFAIGADGVKVLVPKDGFEPRYVYYFFRSIRLPNAGYSRHFKFLREARIPKPPLAEQRRIVDILSRAEGILRLRRDAEKKAAELVPAIFVEMFGDPATNPRGLSEVPLRTLVEEFRYGTSKKTGESGYPTLRIPNVIGDRLRTDGMKFAEVAEAEASRLRLRDGDLLFVRTNGNPDYVGRSAVFESKAMRDTGLDADNAIYASYLIRARLRRDAVDPYYLQAFLTSREGRRRLKEQCRTSAGQYNVNTEGLGSVRVPLPSEAEQTAFAARLRDVSGVVDQQSVASIHAGALFGSLLSRAFSDHAQSF